jgi:hypothetical protein
MTNKSLDAYYQILGISSKASINEIKRAYRQKARVLHPDKNKAPNANDQFILLTEAYECLINIKPSTTKIHQRPTTNYSDWQSNRKEQARQRATEYARMKYNDYKKTEHYKKSQAFETVIDHLYFFSSILILTTPFLGLIFIGWAGFVVGILITFFSVHYWAGIFKEKTTINFKTFFYSLLIVIRTKTFKYTFISLINIFFLLCFTFNTQLELQTLSLILLSIYAFSYLTFHFKLAIIKNFTKVGVFICFVPTIFNLIFFINFVFSSNPTTETYSFVHEKIWYGRKYSRGSYEKIGYIFLENNKYEDYYWFRSFFDFDSMKNKSEIKYTFENGLLGFRVLKDYQFTK